MRYRTWVLGALVLTVAMLTGCGVIVRGFPPQVNVPPPERYQTIVLGAVTSEDRSWETAQPRFRKGVLYSLNRRKTFDVVKEQPQDAGGEPAVTLKGVITRMDEGSLAARAVVGFGAGAGTMKGTFELTEPGGRVLLRFDNQARLYSWSADFEQAAYTMGFMVAETVSRWSKGELRE